MAVAPWWKLFASDYLLDPDVDSLPLEAQAILVRMWCVIWIEGEIPDDPAQIARKCRIEVLQVQMHMQNLRKFFTKTEQGALISLRMERERTKSSLLSAVRAKAANLKHQKDVSAHAHANGHASEGANAPAKRVHSDIRYQRSDKKQKPSSADAEASMSDPRWKDFIDDWKTAFEHVTGKKFKPSNGDFAVLKSLMTAHADMNRDTWRKCLNNWKKSPINHLKPFRLWGSRILEYEQGPLDKYWEPISANGKNRSVEQTKATRGPDAAAELDAQLGTKAQ